MLSTHPAEVKSHPRGYRPADCAQFAPIHCQPVLVRWRAIEVVFQLCRKGGLWLVTVQPTPVFIAAAEENKCKIQLAKALHGGLISAMLFHIKVPSYSAQRQSASFTSAQLVYGGFKHLPLFVVNMKQK